MQEEVSTLKRGDSRKMKAFKKAARILAWSLLGALVVGEFIVLLALAN